MNQQHRSHLLDYRSTLPVPNLSHTSTLSPHCIPGVLLNKLNQARTLHSELQNRWNKRTFEQLYLVRLFVQQMEGEY